MTAFVLVHGAWGGGWQWRAVAGHLRAAGHEVFTPTFTGMGERAHLLTGDVNLETHIQDIIGVIRCEALEGVALVAHSYGGMAATAVADRLTDRIGALIYLDAALPENGQAMLDLVSAERRATVIRLAEEEGGGIAAPRSLVLHTGIEDKAAEAVFLARICPHPLAALRQPISLTGSFRKVPKKAYVLAGIANSHRFRGYMEWARKEPGWVGEELPSHHFPMITMPRETAATLMRLAA
jgi:pimeloyl-ACP methyl ester carboxylesterase